MRYDHLTMLPLRAFRKKGKHLATLEDGGKDGDIPDTPDYVAIANAQTKAQQQLLDRATIQNRVNQVTPYGSLTWSKESPTTFDEAGFKAALAEYNNAMKEWKSGGRTPQQMAGLPWAAGYQGIGYNNQGGWSGAGGNSGMPSKPTEAQFTKTGTPRWTATTTLAPELQKMTDALWAVGNDYLQDPLTMNDLPAAPINPGQTAQDALMSRLEPYFQRRKEGMETQLVNQGITRGSEAWARGLDELGRTENDAFLQAGLHGIDVDMRNQAQQMQLASALRSLPVSITNAIKSGQPLPQWAPVPQAGAAPAPDLLGAANAGYTADVNRYNAQQASSGSFLNGLMSLGGAYLSGGGSLPFMGGGAAAGGTSIPINFGASGANLW